MIKILYFSILFFPLMSLCQNNIKYEKGVKDLVRKYEQMQLDKSKIDGWRIQISFANKKSEITKKKIMLMNRFPAINAIYLTYTPPYYRLRIGNFRTKLEGEKLKYEIKKYYPNAYLVPEKINIEELKY